MKVVEFKSPIKFEVLLKVHFEKEIFNLLCMDNENHTIDIMPSFSGEFYRKEWYDVLHDLKELLAYELTDYLFKISNSVLIIDNSLYMCYDKEDNICFCRVVHED